MISAEEEVAAGVKADATRELRRRDDFLAIMGSESGRRFVWQLMGDCSLFLPIYSPDHSEMSYKEGRRQIGLKLLADCNELCPELYLKMMNENTQPTEAATYE